MKLFGELGIGVSIVISFFFLALIAEIFCVLKWKKKQKKTKTKTETETDSIAKQDLEFGSSSTTTASKDYLVEAEITRFQNQRFLFTIKEETNEDLESESSSLSPLACSPLKSDTLDCYDQTRFESELESSLCEVGYTRFGVSSPPTTRFKFLRDAEEKLLRRLKEEGDRIGVMRDKSVSLRSLILDDQTNSDI